MNRPHKKHLGVLLLIALSGGALAIAPALAHAAELFVWQPTDNSPKIILAAPAGATYEDTVRQYLERINKDPSIADIRDGSVVQLPIGKLTPLAPPEPGTRPRILATINSPHRLDFLSAPKAEIPQVAKLLEQSEGDPYFLPLIADAGLPPHEAEEFRKKATRYFDGILALGGDDVHPVFYDEPVTHARHINEARDASELGFIRQFIQSDRGAVLGICRGHQLCAVAQGHKLIQDIPIEAAPDTAHRNSWHTIQVEPDSYLHHLIQETRSEVNSYHHQAVLPKKRSPLRVTANSVDAKAPIVEATEFKNGRGMTFQFHPELMDNPLGRTIMRGMVGLVRTVRDQGHCPAHFGDL